jgi:hypothetical protein
MLPFFEAHPLGFDDDTACETVAIPAPSAPVQLTPVDNGDRAPTHCLLCHLMRAMNGAVHVDVARISAPIITAPALPAADLPARSVALSSCSSRGPPAALSI